MPARCLAQHERGGARLPRSDRCTRSPVVMAECPRRRRHRMTDAVASDATGSPGAFVAELSSAWTGRPRFVVLDDCFDGGSRFLQCLQAWRADPHRCTQLHVITVSTDVASGCTAPALAQEIGSTWPPITPNPHRLSFEGGQVQWLLMPMAWRDALRELATTVDAFVLSHRAAGDASASRREAKALARLARADSLVWCSAASGPDASAMRSAGFVQAHDHAGRWRHAPSFVPRHGPSRRAAQSPDSAPVLVIGGGLAGCAVAWALAEQGRDSVVVERHQALAMETSGNPAGLFHGTVNPQDGAHARFNRAAALEAQRAVAIALAGHGVQGSVQGLLRLEDQDNGWPAMHDTLQRLGLPPGYVQALTAQQASARCGIAVHHPVWWYPGGGWVQPAGLARSFIERAGRRTVLRTGCAVESLTREPNGWALRDASGRLLAVSDTVVLANAGDALRLLRPLMPAASPEAWPLQKLRGQISMALTGESGALDLPRVPITGAGYLLPPIDGMILFGATSQAGDDDPTVRDSDHRHNLAQLSRLTGQTPQINAARLTGRTGWRWTTDDRLPVLGAVPDVNAALGLTRLEQPAQVPRAPGLHACTGFGSRGITWAALAAQITAASITGAPMPIESSLLNSVDAARFVVREAARRARRNA
ncbi:MAG: oxidoreductase [Burkholderiales bacterium PBB1]|nr:MAG: oxidoreductase [Burkholderiales bacterium PBB1]